MTQKQIDSAKHDLHSRIRKAVGTTNLVGWAKTLKDEGRIDELSVFENESYELFARGMINSCLCYSDDYFKPIYRFINGEYVTKSYAEEAAENIFGGMKRVKEIFAEQEADFKKATVLKNVFVDDEGVSYNSIKWAD